MADRRWSKDQSKDSLPLPSVDVPSVVAVVRTGAKENLVGRELSSFRRALPAATRVAPSEAVGCRHTSRFYRFVP
jgi:hypothetical protein